MGFMDKLKGAFGGAKDAAKAAASEAQGALTQEDKQQIQSQAVQGLDEVEGAENIHVHGTDDDAKVIKSVPGADLIEEDGEALWTSRHNEDVPFEQWQDVWGPLGGHSQEALETFCWHMYEFDMLHEGDPHAAEAKLQELGWAHVGEYFAGRITIGKYWGTRHGENVGDVSLQSQEFTSAALKGNRMYQDAQMAGNLQANPALVEPIEGITIEVYGQIGAQQAQGLDQAGFQALLGQYGMDQAMWERVQAGWLNRMSKDTDGTLAQIYSKAFQTSGQGQFGAAGQAHAATGWDGSAAGGAEPIPFEKACEIQGAMTAWSNTGQDVNALLQSQFGMNAADWAAANTWWMSQLTADVSRFAEYDEKCKHYEAHYSGGAGGGADSDIEF